MNMFIFADITISSNNKFMKPPSDALIFYFKMFHLPLSLSSLQFKAELRLFDFNVKISPGSLVSASVF